MGTLCGLWKAHKTIGDVYPPFRPILSANYLVLIQNCWTSHEFTIKDSFLLTKEIVQQGSSLYLFNLDVDSIFTNTAVEETIFICTKTICNQSNTVEGLNELKSF